MLRRITIAELDSPHDNPRFDALVGPVRVGDSSIVPELQKKEADTVRNFLKFSTILAISILSSACHKAVALPLAAAPPVTPAPLALPPTIALTADRTSILPGDSVTLRWQSDRAASVTIDNSIGNVELNGVRQVRPQTSTSYVAIARGPGGTASSQGVRVSVNVAQPAVRPATPPGRDVPARMPTLAEQFQTAMQNVLFDYDKSTINSSEIPKLQSAAQWLLHNPSVRLTVEGNADERGGQEYNIALGDERAAAVKRYLSEHGVTMSRIEAVSYGEERPLCREENEACWRKNRRAQFAMRP